MAATPSFFTGPEWSPLPEYKLTPSGQPLSAPQMPLGMSFQQVGVGPLGTPLFPHTPAPQPQQASAPTGGGMSFPEFSPSAPTSISMPGVAPQAPSNGAMPNGMPFGITGRDVAGGAASLLPFPFNIAGSLIARGAQSQPAAPVNPFSFDIGGSTLSLPSGSPMAGYSGATFGGQAVSPGVAEALAGGDLANAMAAASQYSAAPAAPADSWNYGSGIPGDFAFSDPSMGGYDFGFSGGPGY